jgi:hypothetical protein
VCLPLVVLPEGYAKVSTKLNWLQHNALPKAPPAIAAGNPAVDRPNTSETGCLVMRVSRHRAPFFGGVA